MRRCIGLDVHRELAQVAIWEDSVVRQAGRIQTTPEALREFADSLCLSDEVALEATGNTDAIARLLEQHVGRVVVSNPQKTRAIAEAKVKTDKVDAAVLAQLLAAGFLPSVWLPDEATFALRRQVVRRAHIVRQRTRLKNQVQSILHRNLIPRCPGRRPVRRQRPGVAGHPGPAPRRAPGGRGVAAPARLPRPGASDRRRRARPGRPGTRRGPAAADHPWGGRHYLGLNPRVRQSGGQPAQHGRITKQGRAHARGMLVEAAWAAAKTPGPLGAFYERVRARRGMQVAVVATARRLATLCWQLVTTGQDYAFARPSLTDKKLRALELRAGLPARRGQRGTAATYSLKEVRRRERALAEQAEVAYRQLVAGWQPKPPAKQQPKRGVAATTGARR
jgi:transposase